MTNYEGPPLEQKVVCVDITGQSLKVSVKNKTPQLAERTYNASKQNPVKLHEELREALSLHSEQELKHRCSYNPNKTDLRIK